MFDLHKWRDDEQDNKLPLVSDTADTWWSGVSVMTT
jgi:hypothetical protein